MIWHPHPGQSVVLHYRTGLAPLVQNLDGCRGTVLWAGRGRGPINVEVLLDPPEADVRVTVPRGNLMADKETR